MNVLRSLFLFLVLVLTACKSDTGSTVGDQALITLEKEMNESKDPKLAQNYLLELNKLIQTTNDNPTLITLLKKGLDVSKQFNFSADINSYLMMLTRKDKNPAEKPDYLYELASRLKTVGKVAASDVLFRGFAHNYPENARIKAAMASIAQPNLVIDTVMYKMAEQIFVNPDPIGINKANAQKYVDACEAYALAYDDDKAATYLYKASEMSRSIKTFPKTLSIYDWILQDYPDSEKAASSLFLKGFILENDVRDLDLAKGCYQQFLDKYPDHQLADDVKFLLDNIGKSDEEIYKIIEKNQSK
jgi:TolA-binding protein